MIKIGNSPINESIDPSSHGYFLFYKYPGDDLSDRSTDIIVLADSEQEAIRLAKKYVDQEYDFQIDYSRGDHGKLKNYGSYHDKYKNANLQVVGRSGIINEAGVINPVLGRNYNFSN